MRWFRQTPALLVLLALAACGGGSGAESGGDGSGEGAASGSQEEAPLRFNVTGRGHNAGSPDAPIRVVEFSDFACPHCREFHLRSYPTVHQEFVETGTVLWKYVPYVLGVFPNSVEAARAGECAIEQEAFPPLRDRLFQEQTSWVEADEPRELFVGYARDEGLDVERFTSCLEEGRRDDEVQQNIELGRQVGIRGTPTFMVDGNVIQGNRPPEVFREVFDRILGEAGDGSGEEDAGGAETDSTTQTARDGNDDGPVDRVDPDRGSADEPA